MSYYNQFAGHLAGGQVVIPYDNAYAIDYNGSDDWMLWSNPNNFNFGNAVTDSPFSIGGYVNMDDATAFQMFGKGDGTNAEYLLQFGGTDRLTMNIFDNNFSSASRLQRVTNDPFTASQGTTIFVLMTYSGNGLHSGITLYTSVGGFGVAASSGSSSGYTAMHNTGTNVVMGRNQDGGGSYANGKIGDWFVFNKELSFAEGLEAYNGGAPFDLRTHSAAANLVFFSNIKNSYPSQPDLTGNSGGTMQNMTLANVVAAI